jgi:hypothetical protein
VSERAERRDDEPEGRERPHDGAGKLEPEPGREEGDRLNGGGLAGQRPVPDRERVELVARTEDRQAQKAAESDAVVGCDQCRRAVGTRTGGRVSVL